MSEVIKFKYAGYNISFGYADGNKIINATEMAKPFGKTATALSRQRTVATGRPTMSVSER